MLKRFSKLVFSRIFIVGVLILLQVCIVVGIVITLSDYYIYFHIFFALIGLIAMFYIINKNDEPSFKLSWALLILSFPIFGGLFYLIAGDNKMRKKMYRIAKNVSKEVVKEYQNAYQQNETIKQKLLKEDKTMYRQSNYISAVTNMPIHQNTSTEFLPLGEVFYERLIEKLENAKHFIFLEFFILTEGKMLNTIVEILAKKVKEGVDVRVMYDDLGSIWVLRNDYNAYLESLGIKCVIFNKFVPILSVGHNNRDHRKIVVIDGYIGFTGGINLADEYINEISKYGHWKDTGILLIGEAVKNLTLMFLELWNYYRPEDKDLTKYMPHVYHKEQFQTDGFVQPYGDSPLDTESVGENVYLNIINQARDYVYITTPYLIIDYTMITALENAAKRGVDVRIIIPHIPDKWFVYVLTQSYYQTLIQAGVKIYEYTPGFIHAKGFVCDDTVGVIGTINLDYRSFCHHFECGVWLYHTSSILQIKKDFLETLEKSREVTIEYCKNIPLKNKLARIILKAFAPLM